jgi:hypothetical protein
MRFLPPSYRDTEKLKMQEMTSSVTLWEMDLPQESEQT